MVSPRSGHRAPDWSSQEALSRSFRSAEDALGMLLVQGSGGVVSTVNSTTTPLNASQTYTGTWEDILKYASISIIGSTDENGTLWADFSTDGSTLSRSVQLSTGTDTALGIHSLIPVAQYFRVRVVNGGTDQGSLDIQTIYTNTARIALPTSRLGQALTTFTDVLNTRAIIANTGGTNANVTNHRALQVTPPSEGKTAFGEALTASLTDQILLTFEYNNNADLVSTRANQSGSVTNANAMVTVQSGAASNSSGTLVSKQIARYVPGHGVRARYTAVFTAGVANNTQIVGLGDQNNGLFFGYNGTSFGIMRRTGGKPEIRTLTVTTKSTHAENITITLDGTAKSDVAVTDATAGDTTTTANDIAAADYSDVGPGWDAYAVGATVIFIPWDASSRTGTYSLSSATSAVGTFAQTVAGTAATDTWVAQTAWNGDDIFDGNGLTGTTLDPTKGNVFQIDYQWLGFGDVFFYIEDQNDGEFHLVHTIKYSNQNTTPSLRQPSLPFYSQSINTSNTSNVTISTSSVGAFTDGRIDLIGPRNAFTASYDFGATNAALPILSIRNKLVYQGIPNRVKAKAIEVTVASTGGKSVAWTAVLNGTLTAASFTDASANTSVLQSDTSATAISGGTTIAGLGTGAGGTGVLRSDDVNDFVLLPGDVITIVADPTANNSDVVVGIRFVELF